MSIYTNEMKGNQSEQLKSDQSKPSHNLFAIFQNCTNPYLLQLLDKLNYYYHEKEFNKNKGIPTHHKEFKQTIFSSLEELLFQISTIQTTELKNEKLFGVYQWFNKKYKQYTTVANITDVTSPNPFQTFTDMELGILKESDRKEEEKQAAHRSILYDFAKPKEILKNYSLKQVNNSKSSKPFDNNAIAIANANKKNEQGEKMGMTTTFGYKTFRSADMRTTLNSTARTKNFLPSVDNKQNDPLIDPLHEMKYSYSFYRPHYSFAQLDIEANIVKAKNKALADKRAQDEINTAVDNFGFSKSAINKSLLHKSALKDLVLYYKKKDISQPFQEEDLIKEGNEKGFEKKTLAEKDKEKEKVLNQPLVKQMRITRHMSTVFESKIRNMNNVMINSNRDSKGNVLARKKTTVINRKSISNAMDIGALIGTQDQSIKITTQNIMNVNTDGQLIPSQAKEVVYDIKMRLDSLKVAQENYEWAKKENGVMPNDFLCKKLQSDKIQRRRLLSEAMMTIRKIDNYRDGYSKHYEPLSRFDMIHSSSFREERPRGGHFAYRDDQIPRTSCGYSRIKYEDNHLSMRRTLDTFKFGEVNLL